MAGTIDISPGITGMFDSIWGPRNLSRALSLQGAAQRGDLAATQAELNREKLRAAIAERERQARLERPEALDEILTALGGVDPAQASAARRHFGGDPLRLPSDPLPPPPAEVPGHLGGDMGSFDQTITPVKPPNIRPEGLSDENLQRLGRIFGAFRGANLAGGKVDDVAQAIRGFLGESLTNEQASLARAGDPSTVSRQNRLGAASRGAAYEPYSASQHGPYNQESGALANPDLYQADVGATRGLETQRRASAGEHTAGAGEKTARADLTRQETTNLKEKGLKEPGRPAGGARTLKPYTYSDARKAAAIEAKQKGLTGEEFDDYVRVNAATLVAGNKGDQSAVRNGEMSNAALALKPVVRNLGRKKPADREKAIVGILTDLKSRGFDADEAQAILTLAGYQ